MNKITFSLPLLVLLATSSPVHAEYSYPMDTPAAGAVAPSSDAKNKQTTRNIVDTMTDGGIQDRSTDSDVAIPASQRQMTGYEEALLEHFVRADMTPNATQMSTDSKMAFDVKQRNIELTLAAEEKAAQEKATIEAVVAEENKIDFGQAYCFLNKDVVVERIATYAYLDCDFPEPIGRGKLAVSMVPEFYAKALIANPLYVVTSDNRRLPVSNGVVMTKDRNSVNVANLVNDRLLEKMTITSGYKSLGIVAEQAQAYLDAKSAARYQSQSTVSGGLNPVVVQDTRVLQPQSSDYFATATVQLISEVAKIVGENMVANLPYTFKVNKGNVFYADLQFANDKNMEGYKIQQTSIIATEPDFNDGTPIPVPRETVPVLNNHSTQVNTVPAGVPNLNPSVVANAKQEASTISKGKNITFPTSTIKY